MISDTIYKYLGTGGAVQRAMQGFELRPQQLEMAQAVGRAFDDGGHLMVEAGTGTGKSLAYLIPAVLWAVKNNKKVVVSTYTRALQQQILKQDIPFLQDKLGLEFKSSLCVGFNNYLSLRRLNRSHQTELFTREEDSRQLAQITDWAGWTKTGMRDELPFEVSPAVWEDVGRQRELCLGKRCETYDSCFYFKARRRWFGAHLLVVNHHLFFANIASGGGVLPKFDAVIFDEAQNIEEAATQFLGLDVSNSALFFFLDRLHNPRNRRGVFARLETDRPLLPLQRKVGNLREAAAVFFSHVFEHYGHSGRVLRLYRPLEAENLLSGPLDELREALLLFEATLDSEEDRLEVSAAATRCAEFKTAIEAFLGQQNDGFVYWLEISEGRGRKPPRALLRAVPIDVSPILKEQVFDRTDRVVMTSATLTANRSFDFIARRVGFEPKEEKILDSPFDYAEQMVIYVPPDMTEPSDDAARHTETLSRRVAELIRITDGRTFVLFTSYETLNRVYHALEPMALPYPLLRQGELSPTALIEKFKKAPSVILGTNSFWQGVDVPGDALQSVIITKLPFDVPSDPLIEARIEDLKQKRLHPFRHYQIPRAIIQLKQGFGRLIRKRTDLGVVSILDPRLINRSYGKQFLNSLPPGRIVDTLDEVRSFFEEKIGRIGNAPSGLPAMGKIISLESRRPGT